MPRPDKQVSTDSSERDLVKVILVLTDGVTLFGRTSTEKVDENKIQLIDFRRDHRSFTIPKEEVSGILPISVSQKPTDESTVAVDSPLVQTLSEVTKERVKKPATTLKTSL